MTSIKYVMHRRKIDKNILYMLFKSDINLIISFDIFNRMEYIGHAYRNPTWMDLSNPSQTQPNLAFGQPWAIILTLKLGWDWVFSIGTQLGLSSS